MPSRGGSVVSRGRSIKGRAEPVFDSDPLPRSSPGTPQTRFGAGGLSWRRKLCIWSSALYGLSASPCPDETDLDGAVAEGVNQLILIGTVTLTGARARLRLGKTPTRAATFKAKCAKSRRTWFWSRCGRSLRGTSSDFGLLGPAVERIFSGALPSASRVGAHRGRPLDTPRVRLRAGLGPVVTRLPGSRAPTGSGEPRGAG